MKKRKKSKRQPRTYNVGIAKHSRHLKGIDGGPLAKALGAKIKAARLAVDWSEERLAKEIGARVDYIQKVESGRVMPSQEAAHRFIKVLWGADDTWKDRPMFRGKGAEVEPGYNVRITVYEEEFLRQWYEFANTTGCSVSAVARYALERLFSHEPTLVTLQDGIKAAEAMRAQSLLEACPEYVDLLRADPLHAQVVHLKTAQRPSMHKGRLAIDLLKSRDSHGAIDTDDLAGGPV